VYLSAELDDSAVFLILLRRKLNMSTTAYNVATIEVEAESAIELVRDVARKTRAREEQAAEAINRVQVAVQSAQERLQQVAARATDAETALERAQAEIDSLLAQLQTAHDDARSLQKLLSGKEAELASATKQALMKEEKAEKAVADLHNIADAIRREFALSALDVISDGAPRAA
jgi:chromosome segregation ATPase